jgi:hypothetical protein
MLRQIISALGAAVTLSAIVVIGSTVAWSNIVGPVGGQAYLTKAQFDQAFVDVSAVPQSTPVLREKLREAGWKLLNASLNK